MLYAACVLGSVDVSISRNTLHEVEQHPRFSAAKVSIKQVFKPGRIRPQEELKSFQLLSTVPFDKDIVHHGGYKDI